MRSRLLLCFSLLFVVPIAANAQWIQDGTPVSLAPSFQSNPVAVSDGAGGAIITWQDNRNGNYDIYAQRINASGVPQWTADGVPICTFATGQLYPAIVADGAGGAIIVWTDPRSGTNYDIYVQRVNSSGSVLWTANGVALCVNGSDQSNPVIVSDGAAGAIVAWTDFRVPSPDIYSRRVNSTGTPQWAADGVGVCTALGSQANPCIAIDGAGGAIIAWEDNRAGYDIYAQRLNSAGTALWAANGAGVCNAIDTQAFTSIAYDGANGAVIAWQDFRNGSNYDLYAQRVNGSGAGLWGTDGLAVCTDPSYQFNPTVLWDNTTGAIFAWGDYRSGQSDIYVQRVTPGGSTVWTDNGSQVTNVINGQINARMVSDGAGGAVIAWGDNRSGYEDIYAQRVDATGMFRWATDGVPVSTAPLAQYDPVAIAADGSGGAVVSWFDARSGANTNIYAERVEGRFGYWGKPEPVLFAAKDVPADNGGKVRLEWYGSGRDQINQQVIGYYTIWRAIDQAAFMMASQNGVPQMKLTDVATGYKGSAIRHEKGTGPQAVDYFWELIGTQDATYRYAYSFNASTSFDSTVTNPATHRFQVVAHSFSQFINWPSNVLSGRSVDNVAPPAPLFLTAQRIANWVHLKWNGVHVKDLNKYTVYRATSTGVTPIPPNFLADDTDTVLVDTGAPASALYYIVTATDVHNNQGAKSNEASVAAATGVGNLPPVTALTVMQNHPNPFTGVTSLQVGLPSKSDVRVEIYDVAGRRVRTTLFSQQAKGWNAMKLDALDDNGRALPSGVYFYRVHAGSETVTKKMVIAR